MNKIKIASRKSVLALCQANYVKTQLINFYPHLDVEIIKIDTLGDRLFNQSLSMIGGKGLFIKELETLLLKEVADIAVHSAKDIPMRLNEEFELVAITYRQSPLDSFISNKYDCLSSVPQGGIVGTSSVRREAQIRANFPKIIVKPLRGNVQTRLNKLDDNQFDAIILATAGLQRLNLLNRINIISDNIILPAVGQGALGIEILNIKNNLKHMLNFLNHEETAYCVNAERFFASLLGGSCNAPIAGYATIVNDCLKLQGLVAKIDGSIVLKSVEKGHKKNFKEIALNVANNLINQGALDIINCLNI